MAKNKFGETLSLQKRKKGRKAKDVYQHLISKFPRNLCIYSSPRPASEKEKIGIVAALFPENRNDGEMRKRCPDSFSCPPSPSPLSQSRLQFFLHFSCHFPPNSAGERKRDTERVHARELFPPSPSLLFLKSSKLDLDRRSVFPPRFLSPLLLCSAGRRVVQQEILQILRLGKRKRKKEKKVVERQQETPTDRN